MTIATTAPAPTTAPAAPAAAPKGVKRVSLTGIKSKAAAAPASKSYPVLPDPNHEVTKLAHAIRTDQEMFDALEGGLKVNKAELRTLASPFYFRTNRGKAEIPSSVLCHITPELLDAEGKVIGHEPATSAVLVTFTNKYGAADEEAVKEIIGEELVERFFRQKFELKIDGDLLPAGPALDEHGQPVLDEGVPVAAVSQLLAELGALFEKYEASAALTQSEKIVPVSEFHTARHTALTPEQNAALELVVPCQAMIKTKNVKL
jgi:hypothetical protein